MGRSAAINAKRSRNGNGEVRHEQNEYSGVSFAYLPSNIVDNILLRLSIKRIVMCKCVCKTWYEIISDPSFAKIHFDQSQICPLLRSSGASFMSRILYLVQEEKVGFIQRIHDRCYMKFPQNRCLMCQVKVNLDAKFRIPLRNFENIQNNEENGHSMLNHESSEGKKKFFKLKMKDHNYSVVNSCNGFLCLSNPSNNDPVIICNPVTGEFINLPNPKAITTRCLLASGFGFSHTTNQYKVIRMFRNRECKVVAEIHVVGTESWKGIHRFDRTLYYLSPTSLNGCLYWLSEYFLVSINIDTECFGSVSLPRLKANAPYENVGMGVLGKELCITEVDVNDVNVWVMKDNDGGEKRWSKLFSFRKYSSFQVWPNGSLQPINLNDGTLVMFNSRAKCFIYKDPKKVGYKCRGVRGIYAQMEAIQHCPSFVSLKDILPRHGVEVLNVNSRCGALKLHNESKVVSLLEEYRYKSC